MSVHEFETTGGGLLETNRPEAVLLASLHCLCRCAVSKALQEHTPQRDTLLSMLDAAMASHADRIGVGLEALQRARQGVQRVSATLGYLDALPL
ncbi:MAG: hypothetical protein Q8K24_05835 [Hydrogenophaga sp.]|nr:hypothetical protein [Hydrogenophaga sp.]